MTKVLVSACLIGEHVRYDGKIIKNDKLIKKLNGAHYEIIPFCPEVESGLSVPRHPCEIENGDGKSVLNRKLKVFDAEGKDVTDFFIKGAQLALEKTLSLNISFAILKDGSPSCGSSYVYDGSFNGNRIKGKGVTTLYLEENNIQIFHENKIERLIDCK